MAKLSTKNLFHSIYPFFLTFIVGRLISQTDLIMASQISSDAAAAFAIPVRISIIDMIVAFSLAPVISVLVAENKDIKQRQEVVQKCLTFTFYLSLVLTALGLIVYPKLVNFLVPHPEIADLASKAVTWLTLSIPMRLCYFAISMAIHGTGNGKFLPIIGIFNLGLNIALNYVFIYPLGFGFSGIYIATVITSVVSLLYAAWILYSKAGIPAKLIPLNSIWCWQFIKKQGAELSRVTSERAVSFVEIAIVSSAMTSALLSFSIGAEFLFFIYTPFVAVLRGTAIEITKQSFSNFEQKYDAIKNLTRIGFSILLMLSIIAIPWWKTIGSVAYNIPADSLEWWKYIYIFGCLAIPFRWVDSLQRASFQADKNIGTLAKMDILVDWIISIPLLWLGLKLESPEIAFSFFLLAPILKVALMHMKYVTLKRTQH